MSVIKAFPKPGLISTKKGPLILLFYDGYEVKAELGFVGRLKSQVRRTLRYAKRSIMRQQVHTGFYAAFLSLQKSLINIGCDVRVNDFSLAKRYPHYPIGIAGYHEIFQKMDLPNPRIFGPGDLGVPPEAVHIASDPRNAVLIQPSDWYSDLYKPYCEGKLWTWFAGIDTEKWAVSSAVRDEEDPLHFLVYDKIRWDRKTLVPALLDRVVDTLSRSGHKVTVLRYGEHHHSQYERALKSTQAMVFLCEHETQGLAYQEAMSMNIPILAWDEGVMADPRQRQFLRPGTPISSVPYFSEQCGLTFKRDDFESKLQEFVRKITNFQPRDYVASTLALNIAANRYLAKYEQLAETVFQKAASG